MKSGGIFALLRHRLRNIPVLSLPQRLEQVSRAGIEQKLFGISVACYNPEIPGRWWQWTLVLVYLGEQIVLSSVVMVGEIRWMRLPSCTGVIAPHGQQQKLSTLTVDSMAMAPTVLTKIEPIIASILTMVSLTTDRLVEVTVPQAISQWYLGAGGTVGFHTISGLAALADLLSHRDSGELSFVVWPQEGFEPPLDQHLIVESYPSICPKLEDYGPCVDDHQRDAWRVLDWMLGAATTDRLEKAFSIQPKSFGRIEGVSFQEQVRFEGWIIGVS